MALDVYVGSLTRYYSGDWQNAAEKIARERGIQDHVGKPESGRDKRPAVIAWRRKLGVSLGERIESPFNWDESAEAPYFTARLGWDGFGALVLWAAYAEHATLRCPAELPDEWDDDHALTRSNVEGFKSRYSHLVRKIELWLPQPFDFTFEAEDAGGRRTVIGSAATLRRQLADLNAATWRAGKDVVAGWQMARPVADPAAHLPGGAALEDRARFASSHLCHLVKQACQHELPMKLDY